MAKSQKTADRSQEKCLASYFQTRGGGKTKADGNRGASAEADREITKCW